MFYQSTVLQSFYCFSRKSKINEEVPQKRAVSITVTVQTSDINEVNFFTFLLFRNFYIKYSCSGFYLL